MVWIALAGIVLQVAGLTLAVVGVGETYRESVDADLWVDVRRTFVSWCRRVVLRRPREGSVTLVVANAALDGLSAEAFVQTRPPKPADAAPSEEHLAYLTRYVEALSDEMVASRAHARAQVRQAEARIGRRIDALSARVDQTNTDLSALHTAMVGIDGAGLRRAAVGLSLTVVGVFLTAAGLPW